MPTNFIDLTGQQFGRLLVLGYAGSNKQGAATWRCKCECGNVKVVTGSELRRGKTQSCGCYRLERQTAAITKYGYSNSRIARIYRTMISRCANSNNKSYGNYGGRNIVVCEEWANDINAFAKWAYANGYADGLTIDRIDNNKGYNPDNCRWVTMKIQQNNRRNNVLLTYNGQTHTISEWAKIMCIDYSVIKARIRDGWPVEKALTQKVRQKKKNG